MENELHKNTLLNYEFLGSMLYEKCQEESISSLETLKIPTKIQNTNKSHLNSKGLKNCNNINSKKNRSKKKKQAKLFALKDAEIHKKSIEKKNQEDINTSQEISNKIKTTEVFTNSYIKQKDDDTNVLKSEKQIIEKNIQENSNINLINGEQKDQSKTNSNCLEINEKSDIENSNITLSKEMIEFFEQLNEEIIKEKLENEEFIDKFEPYKKFIIDHLKQMIGLEFPKFSIDLNIYGSHSTGLALESSDIDLAIIGLSVNSKEEMMIFMDKISERFKSSEIILDIKKIKEAKIPIITIVSINRI